MACFDNFELLMGFFPLTKRIFLRLLLLFCMLFLHAKQSRAQNAKPINSCIDFFGLNEGLSQGLVSAILQDQEGFIWIGTKDGLNRYNGYEMKVFRHDSRDATSLPDNYINTISEDFLGNIWVTTKSKGIAMFDKRTESFISITSTLSRGPISKLMRIAALNMQTLITKEAGDFVMYTLPNKKMSPSNLELKDGLSLGAAVKSEGFQELLSSANDPKWIITSPDSIWCLSAAGLLFIHRDLKKQWHAQRRFTNCFESAPNKKKSRFCFSYDLTTCLRWDDDTIALLNVLDEKVILQKPNRGADALNGYLHCYPLNDGSFLLDNKDVLYRLSGKTLSRDRIGDKAVDWVIFNVELDQSGVIWCGTGGYGLLLLDTKRQNFQNSPSFATLAARDSTLDKFNSNGINALYYLNSQRQIKQREQRHFALLRDPCDYIINLDYVYDCKDSLSSLDFLSHYIPYLKQHDCFPDKAEKVLTTVAFQGASTSLWVLDCNTGKLLKSMPFPFIIYNQEYYFLSDALEDAKGDVWFATTQGMLLLDGATLTWKSWTKDASVSAVLNDVVLFSLCPDPQDPERYLWMGSDGDGLFRLDKKDGQLRNFSMRDGLQNGVIYGLLPDQAGNLWMSTNKGIACLHVLPGADTIQSLKFFTSKNGLMGDEFNRYEFFRSPSGRFYFGGVNGLTSFEPKSVLAIRSDNPVVLLDLFFENKRVDPKVNPTILPLPIGYLKEITLPFYHRNFSIEFSKLDYSQFISKHYRYRLEGLSDVWIDNGLKNSVSFTNLDPGTYVLSVNAAMKEGVWSDQITQLEIVILPPWWATWWFRTIAILLFFAFIYTGYRYRIHQLQRIDAIRMSISNDLHDEVGSTLSSIAIASTILQKRLVNSQDADSNAILTQISENANRMMSSITDIVWTINVRNDRYDKIIERMRAYASELFDAQDISVDFQITTTLSKQNIDLYRRKNTYLIFKEALNNIAKYAKASHISIELKIEDNDFFIMRIRDDGSGFDPYATERSVSLSGNGLFSMKSRALDMKGKLEVTSSVGHGTLVLLKYPL